MNILAFIRLSIRHSRMVSAFVQKLALQNLYVSLV